MLTFKKTPYPKDEEGDENVVGELHSKLHHLDKFVMDDFQVLDS